MPYGLKTLRGGALLVVFAAGLAACSSNPATTGTTGSSGASSTTTSAPATSSTTATTAACSAGPLALAASSGGASAGTSYESFTVTNNGPSTCQLNGYPTLTFFGPTPGGGAGAGPKLSIGTERGGPSPSPVVLKAAQRAEFLVLFSDVPVGGAGCTTVASVNMAPPGSSEAVTAPVSFSPCGPVVKIYPFGPEGSESP